MIIAKTERLVLREFTLTDAPFMLRLVNEPSWLQYIGDRNVHSLDDAAQYLVNGSIRSYADHGFGFWIVELNATGQAIGTAGLAKRDYLDEPDLGFAFLPEYTRQGFALEASTAVVQFAKTNLAIHRLVAFTTPNNISSMRLLQKLGFEFERIMMLEGEELNLYAKVI